MRQNSTGIMSQDIVQNERISKENLSHLYDLQLKFYGNISALMSLVAKKNCMLFPQSSLLKLMSF